MPVLLLLLAAAAAGPVVDRDEARVLAELNRFRTRPADAAADLRRYEDMFDGPVAREDDPDRGWQTAEGPAAVEEAARLLAQMAPLRPLRPSPLLAAAARAHADEQARDGATGHRSADGRGPGGRVRAAGGGEYVAEAIAYGFETPERAVRMLVVDDGVPRRGHRVLLLNPRATWAGVGCADHPRHRTVCVVELAETPDGGPTLPPRGE